MTEDEIKERVISAVKKLEEEDSIVLPHYLVFCVMDKAMAKLGGEFPIVDTNPITMSLMREIDRINPGLSSWNLERIRLSLCDYLNENNYADRYFDYCIYDEYEIRKMAISVVVKLEEEESVLIPHWLASRVLLKELSKAGIACPIDGVDPFDMALRTEVRKAYPALSELETGRVRGAMCQYLIENNYVDMYLKIKK